MFIVKVPGVNGSGKTIGCRNSGNAIIKELRNLELNEQNKIINLDSIDIEEIHVDNSKLEEADKLIYENSREIFDEKNKISFLGGDHSITYSTGRAFLDHCRESDKEPFLIVFDSRPDSKKLNSKIPNNENWLRGLIDLGFPKQNILLIGVRNSSLEESSFLKENGIKVIQMSNFTGDIQETCDFIMEMSSKKEIYISIDIGVIDPMFSPSSTHVDAGGFTSREFLYLIQRINKIKNLKVLDITEIDESHKESKVSLNLASKILSEIF